MDPLRNPFAPGAGTQPPELTGRSDILQTAKIALARTLASRPSKSFFLIGLRGVGKTVLLHRIAEMAETAGYETIEVEARENRSLAATLIPPLRKSLLKFDRSKSVSTQVKRALRVLKSFVSGLKVKIDDLEIGLSIEQETGTADSGDLESDLPDLLVSVAQAAQSRKAGIALIVDEVQYFDERELSAMIMAAHRIAQKSLPMVIIGAGLPQLVGLMGRSKSYAERLFNFPMVGPLGKKDAEAALQEPVRREGVAFEMKALAAIIKTTQGYPYFLQEWGYHTWDAAPTTPIALAVIKKANGTIIKRLDESFFRVRFDRLTPSEKNYLRAMAELGPGPHRSGDIATGLNVAVQTVAPLRASLIKKGMVYSPAHGDTAFTVPLFDQFMKRIMPSLKRGKVAKVP